MGFSISTLWVPEFSMYSEKAVSSSSALPTASMEYYLFNRVPEYTECQPLAPEEQVFFGLHPVTSQTQLFTYTAC